MLIKIPPAKEIAHIFTFIKNLQIKSLLESTSIFHVQKSKKDLCCQISKEIKFNSTSCHYYLVKKIIFKFG